MQCADFQLWPIFVPCLAEREAVQHFSILQSRMIEPFLISMAWFLEKPQSTDISPGLKRRHFKNNCCAYVWCAKSHQPGLFKNVPHLPNLSLCTIFCSLVLYGDWHDHGLWRVFSPCPTRLFWVLKPFFFPVWLIPSTLTISSLCPALKYPKIIYLHCLDVVHDFLVLPLISGF